MQKPCTGALPAGPSLLPLFEAHIAVSLPGSMYHPTPPALTLVAYVPLFSKMSPFWNILFLPPFDVDAGYPVYFYEFQHRPSAYAGVRPVYVRSDHGDEIGFVFGKPFLAGKVVAPP